MSRALVVDDDIIARSICQYILTRNGYQVDLADNSEKALSLSSQHDYQLIVMDIGLPDACGLNTAKKIKQQKHHSPFIFAITAHLGEHCLETHSSEVDLIENKPFTQQSVDQLNKVITQ
ncbi:MAG: response regulator [Candidatus Comchoanobacterales bacterium]